MFNTKLGVGLAAAAVAGGYAAYKLVKARKQVDPEPAPVPTEVAEAAPHIIFDSQLQAKAGHNKSKTISGLAANLKQAAESVRSALNTAVYTAQTLALSSAAVLATKALAATSGVQSGEEKKSPFYSRWLISRNDDLIYFIGSVGTSFALVFATFVLKINPVFLWWLWAIVLDGPHVWGTATRTYLDKQELQNRRKLLMGSLSWFGIGTVLAVFNINLFRVFAYTWAYYHLVKQHYGFMILYKKKNNDLEKFDNFIDKALVWVGFSAPFIAGLFRADAPDIFKGAQVLLPASLHGYVQSLTQVAFLSTLGVYLVRQFYKLTAGLSFDLPKHLLLGASIGMHMLVLGLPYGQIANGLLLIVATLTAYHNVQYQRLMWFHNRNKYGKGTVQESMRTYGLATYFGRNFWFYLFSGIGFTLFYRPVLLKKARGGKYAKALEGFFWGFAFLHYYLDSKIWKVRHDTRLNQALQMGAKPAA